jgi:hypothetical protein
VARRRLTVKRIDPWSVLKFGFLANIVLLVIFMMIMGVVWFIIDRLQIVDQICGIATDVGFTQCGINAPNLFRSLILLGLLWVVVQTAVLVFFAFLYNLISDLVGGVGMTIIDDTTPTRATSTTTVPRQIATAGHQPGLSATTGSGSTPAPSQARPVHRVDTGTARQPAVATEPSSQTATRERDNSTEDELFGDR